jgi:hypothetical protein
VASLKRAGIISNERSELMVKKIAMAALTASMLGGTALAGTEPFNLRDLMNDLTEDLGLEDSRHSPEDDHDDFAQLTGSRAQIGTAVNQTNQDAQFRDKPMADGLVQGGENATRFREDADKLNEALVAITEETELRIDRHPWNRMNWGFETEEPSPALEPELVFCTVLNNFCGRAVPLYLVPLSAPEGLHQNRELETAQATWRNPFRFYVPLYGIPITGERWQGFSHPELYQANGGLQPLKYTFGEILAGGVPVKVPSMPGGGGRDFLKAGGSDFDAGKDVVVAGIAFNGIDRKPPKEETKTERLALGFYRGGDYGLFGFGTVWPAGITATAVDRQPPKEESKTERLALGGFGCLRGLYSGCDYGFFGFGDVVSNGFGSAEPDDSAVRTELALGFYRDDLLGGYFWGSNGHT